MFTNLTECFTAICNALRSKKNTSDKIAVDDIPNEILNLPTGVDTSDATATASDIASGKTAYVNGELVTGSLTVKQSASGTTFTTSSSGKKVTLGFRPSKVICMVNSTASYTSNGILLACSNLSGTYYTIECDSDGVNCSKTNNITISDSGFTIAKNNYSQLTFSWVAIE